MKSSACRTGCRFSAASPLSPYGGTKPAATCRAFLSSSGRSSALQSSCTISRLGCERPVSRKHRCLAETLASTARSIWVRRRTFLQCFSKLLKCPAEVTCAFWFGASMPGNLDHGGGRAITSDVSDDPPLLLQVLRGWKDEDISMDGTAIT